MDENPWKVYDRPRRSSEGDEDGELQRVKDGGGSNRLTGYSVVEADSIEDAIEMAKTCPHLNYGTIDVGEVMEMIM